jgi:hypothetical protein
MPEPRRDRQFISSPEHYTLGVRASTTKILVENCTATLLLVMFEALFARLGDSTYHKDGNSTYYDNHENRDSNRVLRSLQKATISKNEGRENSDSASDEAF